MAKSKDPGFSDLSTREQVEVFYKGIDACFKFAHDELTPLVRQREKGTNDLRTRGIISTYYRMNLWLISLHRMNAREHLQGVAAGARSLFELLIDMRMLANDNSGKYVERFWAFPQVERFRVAQMAVDFKRRHPRVKLDVSHQEELIRQPGKEKEIRKVRHRLWGEDSRGKLKQPSHWSGVDLRKRARDLGKDFEELYVRIYPMMSWHVHSGLAAYAGMDADTLEVMVGLAYDLGREVFVRAIEICCRELDITGEISDFANKLKFVKLAPGIALLEMEERRK